MFTCDEFKEVVKLWGCILGTLRVSTSYFVPPPYMWACCLATLNLYIYVVLVQESNSVTFDSYTIKWREPNWPQCLEGQFGLSRLVFGLFKLKRVGQVPFRPLQNLNWPKWILLWNFFSIWPFQEPSRIYQFGPNEVQFLKWLIIIPKLSTILVTWKSHHDLNDTRT